MEEQIFSIEELKALVQKIFQNDGKFPVVSILEGHKFILKDFSKLDDLEKSVALKMVCKGKYSENQIAYMEIFEDLSDGLALTIDSLCIGGNIGNKIFKYADIVNVDFSGNEIKIFVDYERFKDVIEKEKYDKVGWYNEGGWHYSFYVISDKSGEIKKFLDVVKNS